VPHGTNLVAKVYHDMGNREEANARLIAAAPVMRDALVEARKALNTVFGHRCFTEGQQQQIGEALESVIKAIEDTKLFSERERLGG